MAHSSAPRNARDLVAALGGKWSGRSGLAQCVAHNDGNTPALSITDSYYGNGKILVRCHAGCTQAAVIAALGARGLWAGAVGEALPIDRAEARRRAGEREAEDAKRRKLALELWVQAQRAVDTAVERYLRERVITIPPPPTLRYLRAAEHRPTGQIFGAMIAAITGLDRKITAIHRTFLNACGDGKADVDPPKLALGPIGTGSVHLAAASDELGLAEGIETALSAMQLFNIPVWAACGSWLEKVAVPEIVRKIVIFADCGTAGEQAAEKAARVHHDAGRVVEVRFPSVGKDFNDQLRTERAP